MNLQLFLMAVWSGFRDSIVGIKALFTGNAHSSNMSVARETIYRCIGLNAFVFLGSYLLFTQGLMPCLKYLVHLLSSGPSFVWSWLEPMLSITFGALWILPFFALSRVVNAIWFQDIASACLPESQRGFSIQKIVKVIVDTLFSLLIQTLFLLQATVISSIPVPVVGTAISLVFMSVLYALYSFEYKWFNRGWDTPRRLAIIESNWTYFLGFGLTLAITTSFCNYVISAALFAILFPLFIISANEAKIPRDLCDYPLPFFKLTIWMSNWITKRAVGRDIVH